MQCGNDIINKGHSVAFTVDNDDTYSECASPFKGSDAFKSRRKRSERVKLREHDNYSKTQDIEIKHVNTMD